MPVIGGGMFGALLNLRAWDIGFKNRRYEHEKFSE